MKACYDTYLRDMLKSILQLKLLRNMTVKNIARHGVHTIVSLTNPNQWLLIEI